MTTLGTLHGRYWASERFASDLRWVEPPRRDPVGPQLVGEALRAFGNAMPPAFALPPPDGRGSVVAGQNQAANIQHGGFTAQQPANVHAVETRSEHADRKLDYTL